MTDEKADATDATPDATDEKPDTTDIVGADPPEAEDISVAETAFATERPQHRRLNRSRVIAFGVLPGLVLLLGLLAAFLRWQVSSDRESRTAAAESVSAARNATVAMLSYNADTAEKDLLGARDLLTGSFLDSYTDLIKSVVIPGAKEKKISSVAKVPAASSMSAAATHAVVLLYVDQTTTVGKEKPDNTTSTVRVTLDKIAGRWLVSGFEPI